MDATDNSTVVMSTYLSTHQASRGPVEFKGTWVVTPATPVRGSPVGRYFWVGISLVGVLFNRFRNHPCYLYIQYVGTDPHRYLRTGLRLLTSCTELMSDMKVNLSVVANF